MEQTGGQSCIGPAGILARFVGGEAGNFPTVDIGRFVIVVEVMHALQ